MKLRTGEPSMPAKSYGHTLRGLSVNVVVRNIDAALVFQCDVLVARVIYSDPDIAVGVGYGSEWMLHPAHTYDKRTAGRAVAWQWSRVATRTVPRRRLGVWDSKRRQLQTKDTVFERFSCATQTDSRGCRIFRADVAAVNPTPRPSLAGKPMIVSLGGSTATCLCGPALRMTMVTLPAQRSWRPQTRMQMPLRLAVRSRVVALGGGR
jgi:hypothetical protein